MPLVVSLCFRKGFFLEKQRAGWVWSDLKEQIPTEPEKTRKGRSFLGGKGRIFLGGKLRKTRIFLGGKLRNSAP